MPNSDPGSRVPTAFERRVVSLMVDGTSPEAAVLQEQLAVLEVVSRRSGSGAWVWTEAPEHAARLSGRPDAAVANLSGTVGGRDGSEVAAWFILHIRRGAIAALECIAPARPWPEHPQLLRWAYTERGRDGPVIRPA